MPILLKNKKNSTKFQILVEIAANQPNVRQKDISERLEITPQAVSEYIKEMVREGLVYSPSKGKYKITKEGTDYIISSLNDFKAYTKEILDNIVKTIAISPAIASYDIKKGDKVGLYMKKGMLYAGRDVDGGATGVAVCYALNGEDVGISEIKGIIKMDIKEVTILQVPSIKDGGSRRVDYKKLENFVKDKDFISAYDLESYVSLKKINANINSFFGSIASVCDAAEHGLETLFVCTNDNIINIINELNKRNLKYKVECVIYEGKDI
ncbi:MarR family transcriptional regulator [Candidatus Methanoliparum sp. LAM-1]|uniref:DUF7839 domain-containing protein n=1 Tax=Candidatus Methanoliparum sp. LAM-1 TaxID=2874846 RepID=UPI001E37A754|nr:MarR family transcriptional regulator [Candidatus Methanoliparum sp. LAM-1]BDC35914.1 Crp/Fnr family transcriptional regulator [Candidatus Methanoliparum sp. LAM-1]